MSAALIASVLTVTSLSSGGASAASWRPDPGAIFNIPRDPAKEWKLERAIVAAINHAHRGSLIRFSIFSFDRVPVAQALVRAHKRGVRVQVLLNDHQFTRAQRLLRRALGTNRAHKSWSRMCTHGCRSNGDILHSKFYMFSHTGAARHVVMVGSTNLTYNAVHNQYNDLWISNSHKSTYLWFNQLFGQLAKDTPSNKQDPPHRGNENWPAPALPAGKMATESSIVKRLIASPTHDSLLLQAIPWPHYSAANDPILDVLDRVHCFGATGGTGAGGRTVVRVDMHTWDGDRGAWLARKFRQLYADGCAVKLMYGFAGAKVRPILGQRTARGYIPIRSNGYDTNGDGDIDLYSHQKELMISGHYGTQHAYRLAITGSSNYNNQGLTGDEILFLVHRSAAYNAYTRNFDYVWSNLSHPVHYVPRGARTAVNGRTTNGSELRWVPQARPAGSAWEGD